MLKLESDVRGSLICVGPHVGDIVINEDASQNCLGLFPIASIGIAWLLLPVRAADPALNDIVALAVVWVVLLSLCFAGAVLPNRMWKRIALATPFGFTVVAYPVALVLSMISGGPFRAYEVMDSVSLATSEVIAYRVNGGATVDYRIRISHQRTLLPGIILFRDLHNGYHEYSARLRLTDSNTIQSAIRVGLPMLDTVEEYRLREHVVF